MAPKLIALLAGLASSLAPALAEETQGVEPGASITIGLSMPGSNSPLHDAFRSEAEKTARTLGVQLVISDARWDFTRQRADVERFVAQRVRGILIDNCMTEALVPAIEAAAQAGIPVATFGDARANTDKVLVHVGNDNVEVGRMAARFIVEALANKGSVIVFDSSAGWPSGEGRRAGFDEIMKPSGVKIVASKRANWDRSTAKYAMAALIPDHPDFGAVFAASDDMVLGAIDAMSEAGIDPGSKVTVGVDANPRALEFLRAGKLRATVDLLPARQSGPALQYLVAYVERGDRPPRDVILIAPEVVTRAP